MTFTNPFPSKLFEDRGSQWPTLDSLYERFHPEANDADQEFQQALIPTPATDMRSKPISSPLTKTNIPDDFCLLALVLALSILRALEQAWDNSWPKLLKDLVQERVSIEDQVSYEREIWSCTDHFWNDEAAPKKAQPPPKAGKALEMLDDRGVETPTDSGKNNDTSSITVFKKPHTLAPPPKILNNQLTHLPPAHLPHHRLIHPYQPPTQFSPSQILIPAQHYQHILPPPIISIQAKTSSFFQELQQYSIQIPPCYTLVAFGILAIAGSLAPALWMSVYGHDMSGGFALGQYILGVGVLVVGSPLVIHSRTCRCWE